MDTTSEGTKIRLVITLRAPAGRGAALAAALRARSLETRKEPGCDEFEVTQSPLDTDLVVMLELWADQAALDEHYRLRTSRPAPYPPELKPTDVRRELYAFSTAAWRHG